MLKGDNAILTTAAVGAIPALADAGTEKKATRLYYLDWVKAGCIALLVPYHASLMFAPWMFYHMKSEKTHIAFAVFNGIVVMWYIAVLIIIAGYSARLALRRRSSGQFIMERIKRLLVPLAFGVLVVVPPQIYMERLYKQQINYNYWEFTKRLFSDGLYPQGNLSWHHLWYVAYLLVISLLLLPLCLYIKKQAANVTQPGKLMQVLSTKYGSLLLAVPIIVVEFTLRVHLPGMYPDFVHDVLNFMLMCLLYMYGFVMAGNQQLYQAYLDSRKICLIFSILTLVTYYPAMLTGFFNPAEHTDDVVRRLLHAWRGLFMWCTTAAIIGYASRYLNVNNKLLGYVSKAFLPIYIIHQTVLMIVAYYVLRTDQSMVMQFILLTVLTYVFSILIYEFVIRRSKVIGFFFGI